MIEERVTEGDGAGTHEEGLVVYVREISEEDDEMERRDGEGSYSLDATREMESEKVHGVGETLSHLEI